MAHAFRDITEIAVCNGAKPVPRASALTYLYSGVSVFITVKTAAFNSFHRRYLRLASARFARQR